MFSSADIRVTAVAVVIAIAHLTIYLLSEIGFYVIWIYPLFNRSVLNNRYRGYDAANKYMLFGSILHEIFQKVRANSCSSIKYNLQFHEEGI